MSPRPRTAPQPDQPPLEPERAAGPATDTEIAERLDALEGQLGPAIHALTRAFAIAAGPPPDDKRTLDERVAAVQQELEDVPRRGHAEIQTRSGGNYSYDYITEADLMAGIRPLLAKHGVATYYRDEILANDQGAATVRVYLTLAAAGAERELHADGFATDTGDKAPNKAKTNAVRYLLWKTFLQPSDEDPEQENVERGEAKRAAEQRDAAAGRRRQPATGATRGKLVERIGQLSLEADEVTGQPAGRTLGQIPELAKATFGLDEPYPNGCTEPQLVTIGKQLSQYVASERARKESDPDAYTHAELELKQ